MICDFSRYRNEADNFRSLYERLLFIINVAAGATSEVALYRYVIMFARLLPT